MDNLTPYKVWAAVYFIIAFCLIGFAIVSLVQGLTNQFEGKMPAAFVFYFITPFLVFISYLSYLKAHMKLRVVAMAK